MHRIENAQLGGSLLEASCHRQVIHSPSRTCGRTHSKHDCKSAPLGLLSAGRAGTGWPTWPSEIVPGGRLAGRGPEVRSGGEATPPQRRPRTPSLEWSSRSSGKTTQQTRLRKVRSHGDIAACGEEPHTRGHTLFLSPCTSFAPFGLSPWPSPPPPRAHLLAVTMLMS